MTKNVTCSQYKFWGHNYSLLFIVDSWSNMSNGHTLGLGQNGCHFVGDILTSIFLYENCVKFSLIFVCKGPINNNLAMVQIDGLVQEWLHSIANALELSLSCTNPSR